MRREDSTAHKHRRPDLRHHRRRHRRRRRAGCTSNTTAGRRDALAGQSISFMLRDDTTATARSRGRRSPQGGDVMEGGS